MSLYKSGTIPAGLLMSSAWAESMHVKIVWITMLALSKDTGEPGSPVWKALVLGTAQRIAKLSGIQVGEAQDAIDRLVELGMISRNDGDGWRISHGDVL